MVLLLMWVLRSLLRGPMRLAASYLAAMILLAVPDLLLRRYVDPDLPRAALLMLFLVLAGAGLFLRASWRFRPRAKVTSRRRSFALRIAVLRGRDGKSTRTAVVFDRYRRPTRAAPLPLGSMAASSTGAARWAWRLLGPWVRVAALGCCGCLARLGRRARRGSRKGTAAPPRILTLPAAGGAQAAGAGPGRISRK